MRLKQLLIEVGLSLHKGGVLLIIEKLNGITRIISEGENKNTNKKREFYSNFVYLGKNDSIDNYEEVPYEVWGLFSDEEIPKNKVEELQQEIAILQEDRSNLEFVLLDTNFRLTCMELKDEGILE